MDDCVFCRIGKGEIPSRKVYEDEHVFAFNDINPQAPVHILIIPKRHIASMAELTEADEAMMGRAMVAAAKLASEHGCTEGFRTIVNTGRIGGQEVYHLHVHVVGGKEPLPPMLKR